MPRLDARLARTALAAALAAGAAAVPATPAHALLVTTGPEGLDMRETSTTLNRVKLSLVQSGGVTRYRVEMPQFGGRGLDAGRGCILEAPAARRGVDVAFCDRTAAQVTARFGPGNDTFKVDPSFPDSIHIPGGSGADRYVLGAGDDVVTGGPGASLDGGAGDDVLTMGSDGLKLVRGGAGTDTFAGDGSALLLDARDGVAETVACGATVPRSDLARAIRRFSVAVVDLADTPGDAGLAANGCGTVDRAPRAERMATRLTSSTVVLRGNRALVRVRCTTSRACIGRASVALGAGRSHAVRYRIAGRRTATLRVPAGRSTGRASVQLSERGQQGTHTLSARLGAGR